MTWSKALKNIYTAAIALGFLCEPCLCLLRMVSKGRQLEAEAQVGCKDSSIISCHREEEAVVKVVKLSLTCIQTHTYTHFSAINRC